MEKSEKSWLSRHLKLVIVSGVVLVLAIVAFFALRGKSTITGQFPVSVKTKAVTCTKSNTDYTLATMEKAVPESVSSNLRIVGTFNESNENEKISLNYTVSFKDNETAIYGEAIMHGNLAKKLADDGFSFNEFKKDFSIVSERVILTLIAEKEEINTKSAPYFLLPVYDKTDAYKLTLDEFKKIFTKEKFECTSTD